MTFRLARPPRNRDELWHVIAALWGIRLPRVSVCAGHVSPFEAVAHAYFGEEPNFAVWYASRGSGKSLALAALGLTKAFVSEADVTILGGSMMQSMNVRAHMRDMMATPNAPAYAVGKDIATLIETALGAEIKPLPASQTTVRGPHPPLQLLDEIDEMDYELYQAALGQAMEKENIRGENVLEYIVASSTWQNPSGTMSRVIDEAREKGQPVFTWCLAAGSGVATLQGSVPIEDVRPGMLALTRDGYRPVTDAWCSGVRETVRVVLDDGTSLVCTPDHLLATERGYEPAGALRPGSGVLCHTGFTDPVATVRTDPDVARVGQVVAASTGRGALAIRPRTTDVLPGRDEFEVRDVEDVDAQSDPADMVELHAERSRPDQPVVDGAMCAGRTAVLAGGDAVGTTSGVGPDEAVVGDDVELRPVDRTTLRHVVMLTRSFRQKVYDITVEDAHEFVANGIVVHNCWRELIRSEANPHGWMTQRFIDNKRRTVSAQMWHTEYELNEPAASDRAIDLDKVEEYFVRYGPAVHETHKTDEHAWTWEEPAVNGIYVVGADWGKSQDKTVIATVRCDVYPRRLARLRITNRRPWPVMIGWFHDDIRAYRAIEGKHDKTGLGSVIEDYIEDEDTSGFAFIGRQRTQMLLDYITAFEHGHYALPRRASTDLNDSYSDNAELERLRKAHRGVTVADVYAPSKWDSHLPDEIAAMGLAHRAANSAGVPVEVPMIKRTDTPRAVDAPFHVQPQPVAAVAGVVERYEENPDDDLQLWVPAGAGGTSDWGWSSAM